MKLAATGIRIKAKLVDDGAVSKVEKAGGLRSFLTFLKQQKSTRNCDLRDGSRDPRARGKPVELLPSRAKWRRPRITKSIAARQAKKQEQLC
jgi:hypothetical protein